MADSKINIKIGHVEFSGEGDAEWLSKQLDKIIEKIPELLKIELKADETIKERSSASASSSTAKGTLGTLASWLSSKNATTNQNRKFLATAAFIQQGGKQRLNTADVGVALKAAVQSKLRNPSDNLNQNVKQGLCEKDGGSFFVTHDGLKELGLAV